MNKDELLISSIDEDSETSQDRYIEQQIIGNDKEVLTGYPHIDNVHKKYYGEKGKRVIDVNKTMYRYLKERVPQYDGKALSFYGQEVSYSEFMNNIERYANKLYELEIRKGNRAAFLLPSMPETYYMFYALDKLGISRNIIDLRTSIEGTKRYINEAESDILFCMGNYSSGKIKELLDKTSIKRVVVVRPPLESLDKKIIQTIGRGVVWTNSLGYHSISNRIITPEIFEEAGFSITNKNIEAEYEKEATTLYVHTSGTMNLPKTIMTTDECQNIHAAQYEKSLLDFQEKDKFLAIMPPWILYGLMAFHMPLSLGMTVCPIPDPNAVPFDKLFLDIKPNVTAGVPNHYITLLDSKRVKPDTDMSYGKVYACGGAAINTEKLREINEMMLSHGSQGPINPGYSFSENGSVGTANQGKYYKEGSVGIPLPDIEVMVVDPKTRQPLKYNEIGIICLRGALMKGYLGNEEETKEVLFEQEGKMWAYSGDVGDVDEDGFVFIIGREKDLITDKDGFKINPNEIESYVCTHPEVKNCIVFGVKDKRYEEGDRPVAFVELKAKKRSKHEINKIMKEIKKICDDNLSSYYRPYAYYLGNILFTSMMKDSKEAMREKFEEEESLGQRRLIKSNHIFK